MPYALRPMPLNMRLLFSLLILFCTITASAQKPLVRELAPGVFYYFGDELQQKSANCLWVVFNNYVLAVDANYPWGAEEILQEIRKTTNKPIRYVLNTHYHHDHTFGNYVFAKAGAQVVSTTTTAEEMRTLGEVEWKNGSAYSGRDLTGAVRQFPTLLFDDTLVFDDGVQRVELIKMGPAHTGGDAVAWLPKQKILATGDLLVNGNPWGNNVADAHADYEKWLVVLEQMSKWGAAIVIPGHGEPADNGILLRQRDYLHDMMQQVKKAIQAGKSKQQVIESVNLRKHKVYGENEKSIRRSVGDMYERAEGE